MAQRHAEIVRDEDVRSGEPRIKGRRITVRHVHDLVEEAGLSAREVADRHDLAVADVYRALAYYHDHPDEMAALREQSEERERRAREAGAKTLAELERSG
jgi:uncharacterized protein (DUF433 family)